MIKITAYLIVLIISLPGTVCAKDKLISLIPLPVDTVSTTRVNNRLVRTILYTTNDAQQLDIEIIKTPGMTALIDKIVINKIRVKIDNKVRLLDFSDSTAVSIDNIRIDKGIVKFNVEFFVRVHGGSYLSSCEVNANSDQLPEPLCTLSEAVNT